MAVKSLQLKRIILFAVIGLVVFIFYLNYYVGTGNFVDVIRQANIYFYTSAFVAFIVATFFSALTWHSLLGNLKVQTSIRRTLILTWAGYFFDATLPEPGWSGDISKAYMLSKKSDGDVGKTVASVDDTTFTTGQVGLFAQSFDQANAEIHFDDFVVTKLQ